MPKFCVGPHVAPGKVYGQSDFKYVIFLKLFNFVKFLKCAKKYYEIRKLKIKTFYTYKEKMLTDKATIKS